MQPHVQRLFDTLGLTKDNLLPYKGFDLQGVNWSTNTPYRYIELLVSFREENYRKAVKTQFLVINYKSFYNDIINRPTMLDLGAVSLIVHLKLKCHLKSREVTVVHADNEAGIRCFMSSLKN